MTLKNARRRLEELGYECAKDVAPYRYKCRKVGKLAWVRGNSLEAMIMMAEEEKAAD